MTMQAKINRLNSTNHYILFLFRNFLREKGFSGNKIYLPVGIRRFTWFRGNMSHEFLYAHACWKTQTDEMVISLYSANGELIGLMEGPTFIETTVAAFLRNLSVTRVKSLPEMWEAAWIENPKTSGHRINPTGLKLPTSSSPRVAERKLELASLGPGYSRATWRINEIFIYILLRAASECKWGLSLGAIFEVSAIRDLLPPKLQSLKLLEFWMQVLVREGYLEGIEGSDSRKFEVIREIPEIAECNRAISSVLATTESNSEVVDGIILFGKRVGEKFTQVLQGKMEPLELLFPADETAVGAEKLYNKCKERENFSTLISSLTFSAEK